MGGNFLGEGLLRPATCRGVLCAQFETLEASCPPFGGARQHLIWDESDGVWCLKGTPSIPETYLSSSVAWGLNLRVG